MMAWRLFYNPIQLGAGHVWLVLPLCALVAVVYKTIRVQRLRSLPLQILALWAYILAGLVVLGTVFWLLQEYAA